MDTAMTTYARGVSAPKRAVGAFTSIVRTAIDRKAIGENGRSDARSASYAGPAERRAIEREQAWIDAATFAGMRMIPRG
jgi:hypothetical protein